MYSLLIMLQPRRKVVLFYQCVFLEVYVEPFLHKPPTIELA
jgi:hypothetical protein